MDRPTLSSTRRARDKSSPTRKDRVPHLSRALARSSALIKTKRKCNRRIFIHFPLLLRSWAQEQKLTPLPSFACAQFRENGGYLAKFGLNTDCQYSLLVCGEQALARETPSLDLHLGGHVSKLAQDHSPARSPLLNPLADQREVT